MSEVDHDALELERARLRGPDVRTIDALHSALQRVGAAEGDFMQVHKNCITARERALAAESALAALRIERDEAVRKNEPRLGGSVEEVAWRNELVLATLKAALETFQDHGPDNFVGKMTAAIRARSNSGGEGNG